MQECTFPDPTNDKDGEANNGDESQLRRKKTRRGKPRKNALKKFKVMMNNVRGFKTKERMIRRIIAEEEPVVIALTETKMDKDEKVEKIPGYLMSRVDRDSDGGGVMLAYKESLEHLMVSTVEHKLHDAEILWQKMYNNKIKLKIGVIYMPQESRTNLESLREIYRLIEEEVADAQQKGESILILGDLNCKVGKTIEGNKDEITKGGKLLLKMMKKYKMKMVNAEECCEGLWTRAEGEQKSILDYVLVLSLIHI